MHAKSLAALFSKCFEVSEIMIIVHLLITCSNGIDIINSVRVVMLLPQEKACAICLLRG